MDGLNGKMQRGGSGLVWPLRIRPAVHERPNGSQRPRSHGPMQGRHARAIQDVGICANRDEVLNGLCLRDRIPPVRVSRVMERLRSSAVPRPAVRSIRDQEYRHLTPKCRSGHMQGRVARIEVVSDVREVEGRTLLACRAHGGRRRCSGSVVTLWLPCGYLE
jgi:hypothetical protein